MLAAVLHEFDQPLRVQEVEVQEPGPGEVLIRIAASGVCRSDLHVMEGRSVVARVPMVLGHEGAGRVEQVGPGVTGLAAGQPVVIALYGPCGACGDCRSGAIERCMSETRRNNMYGLMPDGETRLRVDGQTLYPMVGSGSLAEYALVREAQAVAIPEEVPLEFACLTGCGVTTGVGAVLNVAQVHPGASVAVIGCGGVGLNVVQGARIAGPGRSARQGCDGRFGHGVERPCQRHLALDQIGNRVLGRRRRRAIRSPPAHSFDISSRAESRTHPGDDHAADFRIPSGEIDHSAEGRGYHVAQGVSHFGAVECQGRHPVFQGAQQLIRSCLQVPARFDHRGILWDPPPMEKQGGGGRTKRTRPDGIGHA